jgi:hypothetical protein
LKTTVSKLHNEENSEDLIKKSSVEATDAQRIKKL